MKTKKVNWYILPLTAISLYLASCSNKSEVHMQQMHTTLDSLKNQLSSLSEAQKQNEANKKLVVDFYQEFFGDKNIDALDKYIRDNYIQHNPTLPDGKDALKKAAENWFKGAAKEKINIQHIGADSSFVYLHTRSNMGGKTVSIADIFRIDNGKIAEHWDVIQEVPKTAANSHPMF